MAGRYDCDVLFLAFKRLGRDDREAGTILDKVYEGHGLFEFETDSESARQLADQFHNRHPLYRVILALREIAGRIRLHVLSRCVQLDAPWVQCVICNTPVKTCERKIPVDGDYRCPVHPEGAQLRNGGGRVCSQECWEITGGLPLDKDRAEKIL